MSLSKLNKLFRIRNQNENGFSLVELMIALAILALFAIGIISAFSGSFQAMADSKYRTVATNLAQKELEKVKNTKDVEYPFYGISTTTVDGIEYTIIVVADEREDENVADVIATISWLNRNGDMKDVRLQTLVYNLKTKVVDLPEVWKIELTADPEEMICCLDDQISIITAEAFDENNERLIPSGTPISFITNNEGQLSKEYALTDSAGRATTELTIKSLQEATVQARAGSTFSNTVTVSCVPIPYEIILSASKSTVLPGEISIIKAIVKDSCGNDLSKEQVEVDFSTDYGYFDDSSSTKEEKVMTVNGVATIELHMPTSGETAKVTGKVVSEEGTEPSYGPLSDNVEVFCTDYSIKVEAEKNSVFPNDVTKITATLSQVGGGAPSGDVSFTTDIGCLSLTKPPAGGNNCQRSLDQNIDNGQAIIYLYNVPGGETATIIAEYKVPGANNSIYDNVQVKSVQFIISIEAKPNQIIPDDTSLITAKLTDYLGNPAADYLVKFFTTYGSLTDYSVYTNSSGIAQTTLKGLKKGEQAVITVTFGDTGDISASAIVDCINYILTVSANTTHILAGNKSTITFNLKNALKQNQPNKTITFTTTSGTLNKTSAKTNGSGNAVVELTMDTGGIATVTGTFTEGNTTVETSIEITCTDTYFTLITSSPKVSRSRSSGSVYDVLTFEIKLTGGPLTVDKVKASWTLFSSRPYRYETIKITSPLNGTETEIYSASINNRNIEQDLDSSFEILRNNTFKIKMVFSSSINSTRTNRRTLDFTFNPYDPNSEYYTVSFQIPTS